MKCSNVIKLVKIANLDFSSNINAAENVRSSDAVVEFKLCHISSKMQVTNDKN